jgi:arginyl-tRNA synthetase
MALDDFRPNLLCNYLSETAAQFHGFFEACPAFRAETEALRNARLALCHATGRVLKKGLELLGIEAPERM